MDSHSPRSRLFVTFGRVRWQVSERVHDCRCVSPWDASGAPSRRPSVVVYPQQLSTNTAQHCTIHSAALYTGRPLALALRATLHSLTHPGRRIPTRRHIGMRPWQPLAARPPSRQESNPSRKHYLILIPQARK